MDPQVDFNSLVRNKDRAHDLDLSGSSLSGIDLSTFNADRLDFSAVDFRGSKICKARFGDCCLEGANIEKTDWSGATLRMCVFDSAQGMEACFDSARIEDCSLKGTSLKRACLRGAKLTETSFQRSVLQESIFDNAEGGGVDFRGADIRGASFVEARLDEADFRGADLRNADLSRGGFQNADFRGALLDGTTFDGADLMGALFDAGAGPYADAVKMHQKPGTTFDKTVTSMLGDGLSGMVAGHEGLVGEISDYLQHALGAIRTTSKQTPDELRCWAESMIELTKGEQPTDLDAVIDALFEGPIELEKLFAPEKVSKTEMVERLRYFIESLKSKAEDPPEEWKSMLKPLMNKIGDGRPLDLKMFIDLLAMLKEGGRAATKSQVTPSGADRENVD